MAEASVFYSWQSDLGNATNRGFIEDCLRKAIKQLKGECNLRLDPCLDRDTKGVPGSPDIVATIFDKIDAAEVFVCDVSIIQKEKRPSPNPNVLLELGYAVKRLGWDRIICVVNECFGGPEELPFDLRQRRVRAYRLADGEDKSEIRDALVRAFRDELALILSSKAEPGDSLTLAFGDSASHTPLGNTLRLDSIFVPCDLNRVPDYESKRSRFDMSSCDDNPEYLREVAEYVHLSLLLHKTSFVLYNGNRQSMNDVRVEVEIPKDYGLIAQNDTPQKPSMSRMAAVARGIKPVRDRFEKSGDVTILDLGDRYQVTVNFGKLHADANAWSRSFFIGASASCEMRALARIFADELTRPREATFNLSFDVTQKTMVELDQDMVMRLLA